jgi:hypothetical protein
MLRRVAEAVLVVQRVDDKLCEETVLRAGEAPQTARRATPPAYLALASPRAEKSARTFKGILRWVSTALWLSPLLLIPKIAFNFLDPRLSDGVTLLFVALVLAFFSTLAAFVLFRLITGAESEQARRVLPPFSEPSFADETTALPAAEKDGRLRADTLRPLVGRRVRARGVLVARDASTRELVRDTWTEGNSGWDRIVSMNDCSLDTGGIPLMLELDRAPLLVADDMRDDAHTHFRALPDALQDALAKAGRDSWLQNHLDAATVTLRDGDEVEVEGMVGAVLDDASDLLGGGELFSDPAAYRAAPVERAGLVLRSTAGEPMIIRRAAARRR